MKLQNWLPHDRPREKLFKQGVEVLSDVELLALLIGSGRQGINCVEWARQQLSQSGGLLPFFNLTSDKLLTLPGLGKARTAQIIAVRELVTRFIRARIGARTAIRDPELLADYLRLSLGHQSRERFRVFFLNKKIEILEEKDLFVGTIDETPVYPREIVQGALACHATAVILAHNHPSGSLQPSPEDIRVTEKIISACSLVDVRVLDHLIVGREGYFSFCNEGLLKAVPK